MLLESNAKTGKTTECGVAIRAGCEVVDGGRSPGDAAEHRQTMADGFISRHRYIAANPRCRLYFHAARLACRIDFIKSLVLLTVMPLNEPRSFELTVPSRLEEMAAVHELVEEAIREFELSEDLAHWIELTISESMINAIQHGNKCDPSKNATLRISKSDEALEVIVEDQGKGFTLDDIADPTNVENLLKPSGRGILIIRSFMDEVNVTRREGGGSRLRMVKRIPKDNGS